MIRNLAKLYEDAHEPETRYKLDLLRFYVLDPVDEAWGPLNITSGYRSPVRQELARKRYGSRAAKGMSQHELGEAADFICGDMIGAYRWLHAKGTAWQLILEMKQRTPNGPWTPDCIHASLKSELDTIIQKNLYYAGGWFRFDGAFEPPGGLLV